MFKFKNSVIIIVVFIFIAVGIHRIININHDANLKQAWETVNSDTPIHTKLDIVEDEISLKQDVLSKDELKKLESLREKESQRINDTQTTILKAKESEIKSLIND